jgi:hypothetical protein
VKHAIASAEQRSLGWARTAEELQALEWLGQWGQMRREITEGRRVLASAESEMQALEAEIAECAPKRRVALGVYEKWRGILRSGRRRPSPGRRLSVGELQRSTSSHPWTSVSSRHSRSLERPRRTLARMEAIRDAFAFTAEGRSLCRRFTISPIDRFSHNYSMTGIWRLSSPSLVAPGRLAGRAARGWVGANRVPARQPELAGHGRRSLPHLQRHSGHPDRGLLSRAGEETYWQRRRRRHA